MHWSVCILVIDDFLEMDPERKLKVTRHPKKEKQSNEKMQDGKRKWKKAGAMGGPRPGLGQARGNPGNLQFPADFFDAKHGEMLCFTQGKSCGRGFPLGKS